MCGTLHSIPCNLVYEVISAIQYLKHCGNHCSPASITHMQLHADMLAGGAAVGIAPLSQQYHGKAGLSFANYDVIKVRNVVYMETFLQPFHRTVAGRKVQSPRHFVLGVRIEDSWHGRRHVCGFLRQSHLPMLFASRS